MADTSGERARGFPLSESPSAIPAEDKETKIADFWRRSSTIALASQTANPIARQISKITDRVTPGKTPAVKAGVQTSLRSSQNRLLVEPSTTQPSVFDNRASSAFSTSASARATIWGNLLQVLN